MKTLRGPGLYLAPIVLLFSLALCSANTIPAEFTGTWKFKALERDGREFIPNETHFLSIRSDGTMRRASRPEDLGLTPLIRIHLATDNSLYSVDGEGRRTLIGTLSIDKKGRLHLAGPGDPRSAEHFIYEKDADGD